MDTELANAGRQADLYDGHPHYGAPYGATPTEQWLFSPRRVLRRWRTMALTLAFFAIAAIGYLWAAPKTYQAFSLVQLSVRRPRIMTQQAALIEDPVGTVSAVDVFNTHLERFKGRTILLAALARLDAAQPGVFCPLPAETDKERGRENRLKAFEKALRVALIRRSSIIRIQFEHRSPEVALDACNAFAQTVEASAFDENRDKSDAAVAWLDAQAGLQRNELMKAEDTLLDFRKSNNIDALESQRKTVDAALQEFNRSLVAIESREVQEGTLLAQLDELRLDPERMGEFPANVPRSEEIGLALERWRGAVVERDSLLATLTPKHPEIRAKEKTVTLYREEALKALERARSTVRSNHALLAGQAETFRKKKDEQIQLAASLEMQVVERRMRLAALERTRDAADQTFRGILARIQDARMAADENTATVKIQERATKPMRPIRPNPMRVLALALLLGLGCGLGLVVWTDIVGDRVTGPEDFEGRGVPVLAVVPHVKNSARASVATATIRQQHGEVAEAFAGLGTMLNSPRYKERSQVILVASSVPGEGKTVASCNLAAMLAKRGRRVLLVDFDLRRPRLAGIFPIPPGRKDLLSSMSRPDTDIGQLVNPVAECPNLDVLASRPSAEANPAFTLGAMAEPIVSWARANYDHIVLDAPPLGLVSDTLTLSPLADLTLVMVRPEVSRKRLTWYMLRRLHASGVQHPGLVVNDLKTSAMPYGAYKTYAVDRQRDATPAPITPGERAGP